MSSFTAAYLVIHKEIKHCNELESAIKMISTIKNNALFYNSSFAEIISEIDKGSDFNYSDMFSKFFESLSEGSDVPNAWKKAVYESKMTLEIYERDILVFFGKDMCSCSKEEILHIADKAISDLQYFKTTAMDNRKRKSKSTAAITVSMGIMIILMFA